jgi:hypothetical protein
MARAGLPHAVATLWLAEVHAMLAWLLIGAPAILLLYVWLSRALRQSPTHAVRAQEETVFTR